MRRRYYADDDFAIGEFLGWSMLLTGKGAVEILKWLTRPGAYTPDTPDNPTQVSAFLQNAPHIDWTQAKLPKVDLGKFKPPTKISGFGDLKKAAQDLKNEVNVSWSPEDRPQIIPRSDVKRPFEFPKVVGEPRAFRIAAAKAPSDPEASTNLIRALMSATPRLTFEIVADGKETSWQIVDYEGQYPPQIIIDHIRTHHSGAKVEAVDGTVLPERQYPFYRQLLVFGLANEYAASLPFFSEMKGNDPIATLTRRMDFLTPRLRSGFTTNCFQSCIRMRQANALSNALCGAQSAQHQELLKISPIHCRGSTSTSSMPRLIVRCITRSLR